MYQSVNEKVFYYYFFYYYYYFPLFIFVVWGNVSIHRKHQEVSCFFIYFLLQITKKCCCLSVFLYSCLPLTTSWSNPTAPKPSFLIFFPATDPPPYPSSPLSPSKVSPLQMLHLQTSLFTQNLFFRFEPHPGEIMNTLQMLFVESCSNRLHRA